MGEHTTYIDLDEVDFEKIAEALKIALSRDFIGEEVVKTALSEATAIHIESFNLEELASLGFSITDPIGQLSEWIAGKLRELASWFASVVNSIVSPIKSVLDNVWSAVQRIPSYVIDGLKSFFAQLSNAISSVLDTLRKIAGDLGNAISSMGSSILKALGDAFSALRNTLSSLGDAILNTLSRVLSTLQDALSTAAQSILGALNSLGEALASAINSVMDSLISIAGKLGEMITALGKTIMDGLKIFVETIQQGLSRIIDSIRNIGESIGNAISSGIQFLRDIVSTIGETIISTLAQISSRIVDLLGKTSELFTTALAAVRDGLASTFQSLASWLWEGIKSVGESVYSFFNNLWTTLMEVSQRILSSLSDAVSSIIDNIKSGIDFIWNSLQSIAGGILETLTRVWTFLVDSFSKLPEIFEGFFRDIANTIAGVAEGVRSGFETLGSAMAGWFESAREWFTEATNSLRQLGSIFTGFVNAVMQLPERLRAMFEGVVNFFENLWAGLQAFLEDPGRWISEHILSPLWNAITTVGQAILSGLAVVGSMIVNALNTIKDAIIPIFQGFALWLRDVIGAIVGWLIDRAKELYDAAMSIGWGVVRFITDGILKIQEWTSSAVKTLIEPLAIRLFRALGISSPPYLTIENFVAAWMLSHGTLPAFFLVPLISSFELRAAAYVIRGMGMSLGRTPLNWTIDFRPLGVGTGITLDLTKALASAIIQFGNELQKFGDEYMRALWRGYGAWFGKYFTVWWNFYFRNLIPIEFPPLTDISEAWLRSRVAEKIPEDLGAVTRDIQEGMLYYLKLKGYADFVIRYWYSEPYEFYTTLFDRFQIRRTIPLGGVWKLPSPTDVARMWIRDVLRPPTIDPEKLIANLTKVYEAVGIYRDIGLLYTLLAFKYPSPEHLAEFYWRGIAKLLWLPSTMEEPEWRKIFNIPDTWKSLAPYELNLRADRVDILNNMISLYMRWHDYFPVAWNPNFPTDKAIVTELMAELPGKLDLRWLTRWGIFQHLAEAGVDVMADLKTIYASFTKLSGEETRRKEVTPEIVLDARFLSRFLIGAKTNPLIAPLLSVAQVHAVLAPELTLLRTGFIDALRRGYITLDVSEELMSGLIKVQFKTGYIEPSTGEFKEITYPKPVFWLPAERRLLQMRAVFDRYNMLLNDLVRRAIYGIVWVAITPSEAVEAIRDIHSSLSEHLSKCVRKISGIEWKPKLDEEYIQVWIKYATGVRTIGVRTWIRRHISRFMGWLFFRIIYGWIEPDTLDMFVDNISKIVINNKEMKILSDEEVVFFKTVAQQIYGIVKRELTPSPSTLATLSEYLDINKEAIDQALQHYKIPQPFDEIYRKYIQIRPIKSDYRSLLTKARTALVKKIITEAEWKKYLERALEYGFTRREIEIIQEIAELEEKIQESRAWSPSILTIITISETIPRAVELLKEYPVKPRFREIIEEYARKKPILDDIRVLINAYFRAKRYVDIPKDIEDAVKKYFTEYGLTEEEQAIRNLAIQLQELVDEAKVWIPTPSTIATISEYVEIPEKLIDEAIARKRIPEDWANILKQYIQARPIADEIRELVRAYYRAKRYAALVGEEIPKELEDKVKAYFSSYGVKQVEMEVRDLVVSLEVLIEEFREELRTRVPSPIQLATLSEYVYIPPELVEVVLEKHRIDQRFREIFSSYINVRPIIDEARIAINAYYRAVRYSEVYGITIPKEIDDAIKNLMQTINMTQEERSIRELAARIEAMIDLWRLESREYLPTPATIATISEYVELPPDLIYQALEKRRIPLEWRDLWIKYIQTRPIADDARVLMTAYYRAVRASKFYGVSIPEDLATKALEYMNKAGVTQEELAIRDLAAEFEVFVEELRRGETIPTLGALATMSEYIEIPSEYILSILSKRRIEATYRELWLKYLEARTIATEVNRVVSAFTTLYTRFAVQSELVDTIRQLMSRGGWTSKEIEVFDLELYVRKLYRTLTLLIPTIRQFIFDATYLPNYESLLEDLFNTYAISIREFQKQLEYYKKLIKNRRMWRHFAWYRTQVTYAYMYRAITEDQAREALKKFVDMGLIDNDELNIIIEGMKLRAAGYLAYRTRRY
jgi:phage-related protein